MELPPAEKQTETDVMQPANFFERHPKITLLTVILILLIIMDFAIASLFLPKVLGIPHPYYHHDLKKNFKGKVLWGSERVEVRTNSLGFKDSQVRKVDRESEKKRLVFIGDSFTEGVGFPYEKTFVGRIAQGLPSDQYEVLNASASSYSPKLYYLKTEYLVEKEKLDIDELVVFIDVSDIQDEITYEGFTPTEGGGFSLRDADAWAGRHSMIYNAFLRQWLFAAYERLGRGKRPEALPGAFTDSYYEERGQWTVRDDLYEQWGKRGVELAVANMEKLYQLCQRHGIHLSVAVYPWPDQVEHRDVDSRQVRTWQAFAEAKGLSFYNFFPDFINDRPSGEILETYYFPGDVHFNEAGHELVAKEWLKEYTMRTGETQ